MVDSQHTAEFRTIVAEMKRDQRIFERLRRRSENLSQRWNAKAKRWWCISSLLSAS